MAEKNHQILGVGFLIGAVALIGFSAYTGVHGSHDRETNNSISAAIQLGKDGDLRGAADGLEAVLQKHPNNIDAIYNLGIAQYGLSQPEEARKSFLRVLELAPDDAEALAELAGIEQYDGKTEAALDYLEKIPAGAGKIKIRLEQDPMWQALAENPRMKALHKKHGL